MPCTLCGECCRDEMKVFLCPEDLRRLAAYHGYHHTEMLFEKGAVVMDSGEHGLPRPRLRFRLGPMGRYCPFLISRVEDDGTLRCPCALHQTSAKPLICRLSPLAREIDTTDGDESWKTVPPVAGCPAYPPEDRFKPEGPKDPALRRELDDEADFLRRLGGTVDTPWAEAEIRRSLYLFPVDE